MKKSSFERRPVFGQNVGPNGIDVLNGARYGLEKKT